MDVKKFVITCSQCGANHTFNSDSDGDIKLYFRRETPSIRDRMVIYCQNCGNVQELSITWPIDINRT
jgi:RNase P subunit RPR2